MLFLLPHSDRGVLKNRVLIAEMSKRMKHITIMCCLVGMFFMSVTTQSLFAQSSFDGFTGDDKFSQVDAVNLNVFPNPTSDFVQISVNTEVEGNYTLSNMFGKIILEGKLNHESVKINLIEYRAGIYIVSVYDDLGNKIGVRKIIKN